MTSDHFYAQRLMAEIPKTERAKVDRETVTRACLNEKEKIR